MIAARRAKALAIRAASGAKRCMRDSPLNGLSTRQHPSQFEAANARVTSPRSSSNRASAVWLVHHDLRAGLRCGTCHALAPRYPAGSSDNYRIS